MNEKNGRARRKSKCSFFERRIKMRQRDSNIERVCFGGFGGGGGPSLELMAKSHGEVIQ